MSRKAEGATNDWPKIRWAVFFLFVIWLGVAILPLVALTRDKFRLADHDEVERVKSVLAQFGTIGDMFGALNCLFSGFAMLGVAYAVILQRRELHEQQLEIAKADEERKQAEEWQRMTAKLNAISGLAQAAAMRASGLLLDKASGTPLDMEVVYARDNYSMLQSKLLNLLGQIDAGSFSPSPDAHAESGAGTVKDVDAGRGEG